ncbi:LYG protein, partial [Amia calva]|nr:LYG protein [Amia calva]
MKIDTTGASEETDKQDNLTVNGVSASYKLAEQDLSRLNDYKDIIIHVGKSKQMDPAVISAIISRQSQAGAALENGWGDCGNAFGLMQVNKLYYTPEGEWNSEEHVAQGTQILIDFINKIKRKFPNWPKEHWFKGGIAAYCAGDGNVESYEKVDDHTPGKDFANDVVARAQWYKKNGF